MPVRDEADRPASRRRRRARPGLSGHGADLPRRRPEHGRHRGDRRPSSPPNTTTWSSSPTRRGTTPAGLNAAIRATTGDVVVRVDGHAELSPGYVRRAVETLRRTGAVNVGGIQRAVGTTPFERAVAAAMTSRFGTGDADVPLRRRRRSDRHRVPRRVRPGGDRTRSACSTNGCVRNQDYELNIRLRAGRRRGVVRPRAVGVVPAARLAAGARQAVLRLRALEAIGRAPAPAVAALAPGRAAGGRRSAVVAGATRRSGVAPGAGCFPAPTPSPSRWPRPLTGTTADRRLRLLAIFPAMHLSWGAGFLVGEPKRVS